jgi:hypothetical protein
MELPGPPPAGPPPNRLEAREAVTRQTQAFAFAANTASSNRPDRRIMPIKVQQLATETKKIFPREDIIFKDNPLRLGSKKPIKCSQYASTTSKITRLN